ncbi:septum site-determining protein MinC [Jiella sp. MQZ9-1]|uniref:Probable septum site-determining protein MinC n=1 Tax=Jiella flava TaxID=2816857 RepID=A0A939FUK3_9HYPH|nr:septum site-determining protein MinC [Jiella flava]MBO0661066.1 septum site-determining protein MinC [Jiella flava]MCD2469713.1 septum site-determining protein MinC [Jiella flava]
MTKTLTDTRPIRLKGRSFLAIVLSPELPFHNWLERLDDLAARSTGFFLGRPIVLDVEGLDITQADLKDLLGELGERGVRVMGIEGARGSLIGANMPPLMKGGRPAGDIEPESDPVAEPAAKGKPAEQAAKPEPAIEVHSPRVTSSIVITEPVRSGQSIIFPEGDVTILGSVASGAEIVAGGSIHVYGTLRGRALAGSIGNASARIFCRKLEAELLAIDGLYKMPDDMDPKHRGQAVTVWLEGDTIKAETLA